jgi:predicted PurR-regulated permease PerM
MLSYLLLQVPGVDETIRRGFDVDPTNIYGFVVGFLIFIIIVLGVVIYKLYISLNNKLESRNTNLIELNKSNIEVLLDLKNILDIIKDSTTKNTEQMIKSIDTAKTDIENKLVSMETNLSRYLNNTK